jgi:hypothetical protein
VCDICGVHYVYILFGASCFVLRHEMQMQPISLAAIFRTRENLGQIRTRQRVCAGDTQINQNAPRRTPQIPARKPLEHTAQLLSHGGITDTHT